MVEMDQWLERVAALIAEGVEAGQFRSTDATASAIRLLAVIDGLSIQAVIDNPAITQSWERCCSTTPSANWA